MENLATIALYGIRTTGFGWIASMSGKLLGTGELRADHGMTAAIFEAAEALRANGLDFDKAAVEIFTPGGTQRAVWYPKNGPAYAGDMKWRTL